MCRITLVAPTIVSLWLALLAGLPTQHRVSADAPDEVVTQINGESSSGVIESIDDQGLIRWDDGSTLSLSQVLNIQRTQVNSQASRFAVEIHLAHGGQIKAQGASLADERVQLVCNFGDLELPVEALRAVVFKPNGLTDAIREDIAKPSNQYDIVWADAGDGPQKAEGLIHQIADDKLAGEFSGIERTVSLERVIAFIAADLGIEPAMDLARIELGDGSTIRGALERMEQGTLTIGLPSRGQIAVPWQAIASISFESDRMRWLSELEPISQEHEPLVTAAQPARFNQSVNGNPLTLRSANQSSPRTYAKGIGVHAYSRLVFRNESGFDRLTAVVGIDAETQGQGDCKFVVHGDGVELWSARVGARDEPLPIDVDITGVQEISLIVEPGEQLDLADHANWCEAKLLKTK